MTSSPNDIRTVDIEGIRQRVNAATPGPWDWYIRDDAMQLLAAGDPRCQLVEVWADLGETHEVCVASDITEEDAEFVIASRSDVPALLDEVERLRKENEALRAQRNHECERANRIAAVVREFAEHRAYCRMGEDPGRPCTCGLAGSISSTPEGKP